MVKVEPDPTKGITTAIGDLVADLIEPLAKVDPDPAKWITTAIGDLVANLIEPLAKVEPDPAKGITTAIGDLVADLTEPLAKVEPDPTEAQSTKELLRGIEKANKILQGVAAPEVVLARMDVTALHPSIDQVESAKLVKETFIPSDLQVGNVDWRAAGLYLR